MFKLMIQLSKIEYSVTGSLKANAVGMWGSLSKTRKNDNSPVEECGIVQ